MIYIASPYTSESAVIRQRRYMKVLHYTRLCMEKGEVVFSPIVYGHAFTDFCHSYIPADRWERFNEEMILNCDKMRVLMLGGWRESAGVAAEIQRAKTLGIAVEYVDASI